MSVRAVLILGLVVAVLAFGGGALWATGAGRCPTRQACKVTYDPAAGRFHVRVLEPAAAGGR